MTPTRADLLLLLDAPGFADDVRGRLRFVGLRFLQSWLALILVGEITIEAGSILRNVLARGQRRADRLHSVRN
jgi:hypothetical protein